MGNVREMEILRTKRKFQGKNTAEMTDNFDGVISRLHMVKKRICDLTDV